MKNINIRHGIALLLVPAVSLFPLLSLSSADEESDDFSIEEIVEDVDLDAAVYGNVSWSFPVALEDMNPEYIILANKHYLLDKSYVPDDLVKVPKDPAKGGIKWAVSGSDGKLKGQHLRAECAQALCDMNAAMREQDGFRTMYLKSGYRSYAKQNTMYKNRLKNRDRPLRRSGRRRQRPSDRAGLRRCALQLEGPGHERSDDEGARMPVDGSPLPRIWLYHPLSGG